MSSEGFDRSLFYPPSTSPHVTPLEPTSEQEKGIQVLSEYFGRDGFEAPTEGGRGWDRLSMREMMFLSRETFLRFLIATKGDVKAAISRLEGAITFRRTVKIEEVQAMAEDCELESRCGKNIVQGFTRSQKPIIYFFPNRNTTPVEQRRAVHAIFMLERARDLMPPGTTNVMVIFNFSGSRQGPPTSISVARQVLHILSSHYPETLSISHFQQVPWFVKGFINLMWPFVDPATKKKVSFGTVEGGELIREDVVEIEVLLEECGGNLKMPYNHDEYWSAMVETCLAKRAEQDLAFKALSKPTVGISESLWRQGASLTTSIKGVQDSKSNHELLYQPLSLGAPVDNDHSEVPDKKHSGETPATTMTAAQV